MQDAPIPRRNPRRPATLTAAGIKRIILGQQGEGSVIDLAAAHGNAPKPLRLTVEPTSTLLAVAHSDRGALDGHARLVLAAAALLADSSSAVVVVVFGDLTDDAAPLGADRVVAIPSESWQPDHELACIRAAVAHFQPRHVLFPDNDGGDGDLGRRLAATEGDGACHISELSKNSLGVRRHGGRLAATRGLPRVLLLDPDIVDSSLPFLGQGLETALPLPAETPARLHDLGRLAVAAAELPLEEADFILSAGNGVADIPTFLALADLFGAAIGASRVAVDDGKFPRAKQIGATGKTVSASVYMAIGISGAIQHLQGIKACRHVIAINSDASAPIVKRADLTIVADAQDVMRHLLREIAQPRRNDMEDRP